MAEGSGEYLGVLWGGGAHHDGRRRRDAMRKYILAARQSIKVLVT